MVARHTVILNLGLLLALLGITAFPPADAEPPPLPPRPAPRAGTKGEPT